MTANGGSDQQPSTDFRIMIPSQALPGEVLDSIADYEEFRYEWWELNTPII